MQEGNREAYESCARVAEGDTQDAMPLLLVGGHGCGKTHLLCSIVDQLRASSRRVGIVFISSGIIPDDVKALVDDPGRMDEVGDAVLLVDNLDRFGPHAEMLESLVRLFLDRNAAVVMASRIHPARFEEFSDAFGNALELGCLAEIGPDVKSEAIVKSDGPGPTATGEESVRQSHRIQELEARLETLNGLLPTTGSEPDSPEELLRQTVEDLTREVVQAREELEAVREESEDLKAENALLSVAGKEAGPLRERIKQLTEQKDAADVSDEDLEIVREAKAEVKHVREEAGETLARAEKLLEEMQANRSEFESASDTHKLQLAEVIDFGAALNDRLASEDGDDSAESEVDSEARHELEEFKTEYGRMQESLVRAHAERDTIKDLLEKSRAELEGVRHDLERAHADAQARHETERDRCAVLEKSLTSANAELLELQESHRLITGELLSLQTQLTQGTDVIERLMNVFGVPEFGEEDSDAEPDPPHESVDCSEEPDEEIDSAESPGVHRADFGEGAREVETPGAALHHVEELGAAWDIESGDDEEQSQRSQSA